MSEKGWTWLWMYACVCVSVCISKNMVGEVCVSTPEIPCFRYGSSCSPFVMTGKLVRGWEEQREKGIISSAGTMLLHAH